MADKFWLRPQFTIEESHIDADGVRIITKARLDSVGVCGFPITVDEKLPPDEIQMESEGYAFTFGGTPDSYGDIVAKGALADSLLTRPNVKLLWQHDVDSRPVSS